MKKAKPRRERTYPRAARVFSLKFPRAFKAHSEDEKHGGHCFVPIEDFRKLEKKYKWMFNRYRKAKK